MLNYLSGTMVTIRFLLYHIWALYIFWVSTFSRVRPSFLIALSISFLTILTFFEAFLASMCVALQPIHIAVQFTVPLWGCFALFNKITSSFISSEEVENSNALFLPLAFWFDWCATSNAWGGRILPTYEFCFEFRDPPGLPFALLKILSRSEVPYPHSGIKFPSLNF